MNAVNSNIKVTLKNIIHLQQKKFKVEVSKQCNKNSPISGLFDQEYSQPESISGSHCEGITHIGKR